MNIYIVILSFSLHYKSHDWCREMPKAGTEATRRQRTVVFVLIMLGAYRCYLTREKNQVQLYRQKLRIINCYLTRRNLVMKYRRKLEKFLAYIVPCASSNESILALINGWQIGIKKFGTKKKYAFLDIINIIFKISNEILIFLINAMTSSLFNIKSN